MSFPLKIRESDVLRLILEWMKLNKFTVYKMDRGGKPVKRKEGGFTLIPFMNPYAPKGLSDIMAIKGFIYFLEVKSPQELAGLCKKIEDGTFGSFMNKNTEKSRRIKEQYYFIQRNIIAGGGKVGGGFVSSVDHVCRLVKMHLTGFKNVWFPCSLKNPIYPQDHHSQV